MTSLRQRMIDHMRLRNYSPRTIQTYVSRVAHFAAHHSRSPADLGPDDVRSYQLSLVDRKVSWSLFNQSICALRLFYMEVLKESWKIEEVRYPRQPSRLPLVVGVGVLRRLFREISNPKHRLVAETLYGAGLRLSEAVHLRPQHIDSERMSIRVEQGKGQKDRDTILPESLLEHLREYWRTCRPSGPWLFPGRSPDRPMEATGMQRVMVRSRERARISAKVSCHTLRHCFATHLLERGVDVRTIQVLLGHGHLSTTSRYLHLASDKVKKTGASNDLLEGLSEEA